MSKNSDTGGEKGKDKKNNMFSLIAWGVLVAILASVNGIALDMGFKLGLNITAIVILLSSVTFLVVFVWFLSWLIYLGMIKGCLRKLYSILCEYKWISAIVIIVVGLILFSSIPWFDSPSNGQNTAIKNISNDTENNLLPTESALESQNTETSTSNKKPQKSKANPPKPDTGGSAIVYIVLFKNK